MAMTQRMWKREQERRRREREKRARQRRRRAAGSVFVLILIAAVVLIAKSCSNDKAVTTDETAQTSVPVTQAPQPVSTAAAEMLDTSFYDNAVFIGNALADGISTYGLLNSTDFYARVGVDLDNVYTTAADNDSMAIVDQLKSKKFNKIFLVFGESELSWNDPEAFAVKYTELIEKVKSYQSGSRIYVLAIPPVTETTSKQNANGVSIANIKEYNSALKEVAVEMEVYYADSYEALADSSGYLRDGISADGINLDRGSYIELLEYIADNAYIPDENDQKASSRDDEDQEAELDEDEDPTPTPRSTKKPTATKKPSSDDETRATATPAPTVNVLKDSAVQK